MIFGLASEDRRYHVRGIGSGLAQEVSEEGKTVDNSTRVREKRRLRRQPSGRSGGKEALRRRAKVMEGICCVGDNDADAS